MYSSKVAERPLHIALSDCLSVCVLKTKTFRFIITIDKSYSG